MKPNTVPPKKPKMTIVKAFDLAYGVCLSAQAADGDVMVAKLQSAMTAYVKKTYPKVIASERNRMLEHEAAAAISRRNLSSRPSAEQIRRIRQQAGGAQPFLFPTLAAALAERYPMPDGRLIPLGNMTDADLLAVIELRRKGIAEDRAILDRLESMYAEMQRRSIKTVRELLAV